MIHSYVNALVRLALPDLCPVCRARARTVSDDLCAVCAAELRELPHPRCESCGGAADGALACCGDCLRSGPRPWTQAVSVFDFGGLPRELIHRLKYRGDTALAPVLARRMYRNWLEHGRSLPDLLVPVPLHWRRQVQRGFNQADLLATGIAHLLGVPVARPLLRPRQTGQQALLDVAARQRNVRDAFTARRQANLGGLSILLVDDVLTTGATLVAAAQALRRQGTAAVSVLTVARG